jgi:hypothetical protein
MEVFLVGQVRHEDNVVEPLIVEYLAASQPRQTVYGAPAGPYEPVLHTQALQVEEAITNVVESES